MQAATVAKRKPRSVRPNGRSATNNGNTDSPMASCRLHADIEGREVYLGAAHLSLDVA
jgi:hypothetical protein